LKKKYLHLGFLETFLDCLSKTSIKLDECSIDITKKLNVTEDEKTKQLEESM